MIYLHFGIYAAISLHKKGANDASRTANATFEHTISLCKDTYAPFFRLQMQFFMRIHNNAQRESLYNNVYVHI